MSLRLNFTPAARSRLASAATSATGDREGAVGHGPMARAEFAAEPQPHAVTGDRGEGRRSILLYCEAQVGGIELHRGGDVVDHIADGDRARGRPPPGMLLRRAA